MKPLKLGDKVRVYDSGVLSLSKGVIEQIIILPKPYDKFIQYKVHSLPGLFYRQQLRKLVKKPRQEFFIRVCEFCYDVISRDTNACNRRVVSKCDFCKIIKVREVREK
jgi:hypothetical protein